MMGSLTMILLSQLLSSQYFHCFSITSIILSLFLPLAMNVYCTLKLFQSLKFHHIFTLDTFITKLYLIIKHLSYFHILKKIIKISKPWVCQLKLCKRFLKCKDLGATKKRKKQEEDKLVQRK